MEDSMRKETMTRGAAGMLLFVALASLGAGTPVTSPTGATTTAVERATAAMDSLQVALLSRLRAELERGGPPVAVSVCRDSAAVLTARIARTQGIELGRTSHRLRNPENAPRDWARPAVESAGGAKAAAESLRVFDLGERVGVLRPIGTAPLCVSCHGPADAVRAAIGPVLAAAYPKDAAVGFAPGDLRGFMWAEVAKAGTEAPAPASEPRD
jgi:hypothetical protein